jgi:ABC-type transport system involved in multi-copper enzyme maturation permease subunit
MALHCPMVEMLPVVQREMAVAARRKTTYVFRMLSGIAAFGLLAATWLDMQMMGNNAIVSGHALLGSMTVVGCFAAAWQGTIRAARCLSEERANGTLGLLFLTPLKTTDVVFGKFTTAALLAIQIAVTLAPMLAVTILFGGVSIGEVSRAALWVANVSFFFIAASMLASALTASEVAAMALSLLFAAATIVFALHDMSSGASMGLNPVTAWAGVSDRQYQAQLYWPGMITAQAAGWMMLGLTALALKKNWHRAEVCPALKFLWTRKPRMRKRGTTRKLGKNGPVEWLIVRDVFPWAALILVLLCIGVSLPFRDDSIKVFMGGVATVVLGVGVVVHSALAVARAKTDGMLDLLAVAPMSDEEIVEGQIRGLKRLFFVPAGVVVVWFLTLTPWRRSFGHDAIEWASSILEWAISIYYVATLPLTLWAGAYSGIWMALKSKGPVMAVTRNAALAVVLPWILPVPAGLYLFVLGMMARQKVRTEFRALLAKRSQPTMSIPEIHTGRAGQWPGNVQSGASI